MLAGIPTRRPTCRAAASRAITIRRLPFRPKRTIGVSAGGADDPRSLTAEGPTEFIDGSASVKRKMSDRSKRTMLLIDQSKFERQAFERTCGYDRVDILISDAAPPEATLALMRGVDQPSDYTGVNGSRCSFARLAYCSKDA